MGGGGTKRIPIPLPAIVLNDNGDENPTLYLIFRDEARDNKISLAYHQLHNKKPWQVVDLSKESVGAWEPNYDLNLWKMEKKLHIFMQKVDQVDGEGVADSLPTEVKVLEITNMPKK